MDFVIGPREIIKEIKSGNVISVTVARNCPVSLIDKVKKEGTEIKVFQGDQKELGTYIGKPFPVALVGHVSGKK